uniref:Uncharacterized protein n=1 Tax=Physcomitrium patens TaxID=3218 RepID=A0A2K1J9T6_PHYPA|nr:hypothetical protein PHYPA_021403 [Physcomitrium patens]
MYMNTNACFFKFKSLLNSYNSYFRSSFNLCKIIFNLICIHTLQHMEYIL